MFSERLSLSKIMVSHLTHVFHSLLTINLSQPVLIFPLRPGINSWVGKIPLRRDRPPTPVILGFPRDSEGKEPTCNAGDLGSIPGLGISYKVQYSCQENSMERGAWQATVHGITRSWTWLRHFFKAQHSENEDHGIRFHHFMGNRWGNSVRLYFSGLQNHCRWWLQPWNEKTLTPWKESYDQPR